MRYSKNKHKKQCNKQTINHFHFALFYECKIITNYRKSKTNGIKNIGYLQNCTFNAISEKLIEQYEKCIAQYEKYIDRLEKEIEFLKK